MKVFKFGGGTLKTAEAVRQMTGIVQQQQQVFVVVSAFNKMTNAFERLQQSSGTPGFPDQLEEIRGFHIGLISDLFEEHTRIIEEVLDPLCQQIITVAETSRELPYDQRYDQVVSFGERLSSAIISAYWQEQGLNHQFIEAGDFLYTDENWRQARPDLAVSGQYLSERMNSDQRFWLTQGFIGTTASGWMTTLGREGSDYTAAILGSMLRADEVVIWKDVPGIMTADPAEFDSPGLLDEISYLEAVELSYFGAKVIHPNTIKPLQNSNIPLIVKSLYNPEAAGTRVINLATTKPQQPVIICKRNQVLLSVQPRDFSFIVEAAISSIFASLAHYHIRINLMQHGAVSLSLVFDWNQDKLDALIGDLMPEFKVLYNTGLELWTIRHYHEEALNQITGGKRIYVQQKSRGTARFVLG